MNRKTIASEVSLEGIGLHTGQRSKITFRPSAPGSGIIFRRADADISKAIPALLPNVQSTVRGTNLGAGQLTVHTVEHVLSACAGTGTDDIEILLDGSEPPAMDGSALEFAKALLAAGAREQPGQRKKFLSLESEVVYRDGTTVYRAMPHERFTVRLAFAYPHPLVPPQTVETEITPEIFMSEIAPARTFGFEEELKQLEKLGLAKGGSLENAIVITKEKILAKGGLRFRDEFARHKILDLLGDLVLTGLAPGGILIEAARGGHAHNVKFAKMLLSAATGD